MLKTRRLFRIFPRCFSEGSEYQKRMFQFEENWKAIADEKNQDLQKGLEEVLTPDQKKYITALAKAFCDMTIYEIQYFQSQSNKYLHEVKGVPILSLMMDWPSVKKNGSFS